MAPKKGSANRPKGQKPQANVVPDSDYIVFGDGKKDKKKKAKEPTEEENPGPPKPSARQVIGGASWTGKLPMNLLSEHCQRQKWNKPDYGMRQMPGKEGEEKLYRSDVTLSKTDPKTRDLTKLPPIRLPPEHITLSEQSSALEARHFAATYALFRINSMKNIHMTLPPAYRDLWKGEFAQFKKEDVDAGRAWKYDEDPFAAEIKRHEIQQSIEKRRIEQQKKAEAEASGASDVLPVRGGAGTRAWERAPKVEMGQQIRTEIEQVIRNNVDWNPYDVKLTIKQQEVITTDVTKLGFRRSHIEEALEICKDQEEVLEWLMIYVPEDDLPRWALPPSYSAGVTLASGDIAKETKLKSLALAGYSADLCRQILRQCAGDYKLAAESLQHGLVSETQSVSSEAIENSPLWDEELQTLEAIYGDKFRTTGIEECSVDAVTSTDLQFTIHFQRPSRGYPHITLPLLAIEAPSLPAYIRLSATRQALLYAHDNLLGEVMMYNISQWLETALPSIIERPGRLSDIRADMTPELLSQANNVNGKSKVFNKTNRRTHLPRRSARDTRSSLDVRNEWQAQQQTAPQVKMLQARQRLPAWSKRSEITQAISNHQITIISGETGSGKSTQVVQFVLDEAIEGLRSSPTTIICTQPRRVATLSLAERVSSERCSPVGDEVGYIIRGEAKVSDRTKITFMTTGVLLRRLQSARNLVEALSDVSHVFIDEVHERSLDTDFLLALLKDCLKAQPKLKVILMSATIDAEIFSNYFGGKREVALVHIEGRTFPVNDVYLDDVVLMTRFNGAYREEDAPKAIQSLGMGINYDLIRDLVDCIDKELANSKGGILIFLPGTLEIDRCLRSINNLSGILGLPLHASLMPVEQRKVFPPAPPGKRKVVVATNVAETSITIEDIVAVIDTGRVKETNYDTVNNIVRLEEVWASQAACKQRRGRAGRVREGTCYKLFTRNTESKMASKNLPEIQRVPLEQLCLSVKATGADRNVSVFLSQTLTPPDASAVDNAIRNLHIMGALDDNRLTAMGTYLSLIPADLRCAKLLVYGTLFGCLEACLTISSILTHKSPFVSPKDKREEANKARASFGVIHGDLLLDMAAYDQWTEISQQSRYREVQDWCSTRFLSQQTLRDISTMRWQLLDSLKDAGLVPLGYKSPAVQISAFENSNETLLLRALVAASLQPQIAGITFPSKKFIASMTGAKELDPEANTIKYFIPDESTTNDEAMRATKLNQTHQTTTSSSVHGIPGRNDMTRAFIHPSSSLFTSQTFPFHATHLSYFTKMQTTKLFIRDLTPLNIYSLLLFGGRLELDTTGAGLLVGGVWKVRGWARIGVLVSRLRVLLDEELGACVNDGGVLLGRLEGSRVVQIVKRLIELNGQDQ